MARSLTIASSAAGVRLGSWLYKAKGLTWDISPVLCTPSISDTASDEFRYGSSVKASNDRPQRGSRSMFTVGPRLTIVPLARSSAPITAPYLVASDRSQVAASDTPAGSWVTPATPSPTPFGPSCRLRAGTH